MEQAAQKHTGEINITAAFLFASPDSHYNVFFFLLCKIRRTLNISVSLSTLNYADYCGEEKKVICKGTICS